MNKLFALFFTDIRSDTPAVPESIPETEAQREV